MKIRATLLAMSLAMPMSADAQTAESPRLQPSPTAAAEAEIRRLDAERRIARQNLRVVREQVRLDAEKAKLPAAAEPPPAAPPPPPAVPAATPVTPAAVDTAPPAPAAPDTASTKATVDEARRLASAQEELAADKAAQDFGKLGFGAGLSLTIDLGTKDRIAEAQLVKGIVRVTDQNNAIARLLLETHFLFKPEGDGPFGVGHDMWGVGPFVAVQPGEERIIEAVGLGLMIAFRREATKTDSFNIGIGLMIDPNTRVLGDGFVANAAPPNGEEEIRYRETAQKGLMLMTSFSF